MAVEFDLSNYATKADLKNATSVDTSDLAKMVNLANLKSEVYNLDIGKLQTTHVDLSRLSDVVKNEVVKKTVHDELVKKVKAIKSTSNLVKYKSTQLDTRNVVKTSDYDTKLDEIENESLVMIKIISILLLTNSID